MVDQEKIGGMTLNDDQPWLTGVTIMILVIVKMTVVGMLGKEHLTIDDDG